MMTGANAQKIPDLYVRIGKSVSVPPRVLYALALQESGAQLPSGIKPWPWTLNIEGKPYFFATRGMACEMLTEALTVVNAKRIDVGLAQINFGWHHERFSSACEALSPAMNLKVAADLLRKHYEVTFDWVKAAGRYHRPAGGKPVTQYQRQFKEKLQLMESTP